MTTPCYKNIPTKELEAMATKNLIELMRYYDHNQMAEKDMRNSARQQMKSSHHQVASSSVLPIMMFPTSVSLSLISRSSRNYMTS